MKFFPMNNFAVIGKSFNFVRENVIVFLVHLLSPKRIDYFYRYRRLGRTIQSVGFKRIGL